MPRRMIFINRGDPLSRAEVEVLEMVAGGRDSMQIAAVLNVVDSTICRRLRTARIKLGAQTIAEAAVKFDRMRRKP